MEIRLPLYGREWEIGPLSMLIITFQGMTFMNCRRFTLQTDRERICNGKFLFVFFFFNVNVSRKGKLGASDQEKAKL